LLSLHVSSITPIVTLIASYTIIPIYATVTVREWSSVSSSTTPVAPAPPVSVQQRTLYYHSNEALRTAAQQQLDSIVSLYYWSIHRRRSERDDDNEEEDPSLWHASMQFTKPTAIYDGPSYAHQWYEQHTCLHMLPQLLRMTAEFNDLKEWTQLAAAAGSKDHTQDIVHQQWIAIQWKQYQWHHHRDQDNNVMCG
jgi:hypothetical protein